MEAPNAVEFRIEEQDLRASRKRSQAMMPRWYSQYYYFGLLPVFTAGLAVAIQSLTIAMSFMVLFVLAGWAYRRWAELKLCRDRLAQPERALKWQVSLTDEGIAVNSDSQSSLYRWPYINEIQQTSSHIYFVLTSRRQVQVPKRAFATREQVDEYVAAAAAQIAKHATNALASPAE